MRNSGHILFPICYVIVNRLVWSNYSRMGKLKCLWVEFFRELSQRLFTPAHYISGQLKYISCISVLLQDVMCSFLTVLSHCILFSQELKKSGTWKPQLELYKKQIAELHQRLSEETKRADKNDFECKNMQEKLSAVQREKEVGGYEVM